MPIVTITGQYASGTRDIGQIVANRLGLDYVDRELLVQAAQALGVSVSAVEERDERAATIGERLAHLLRNFLERSAAAGASDPTMGTAGLELLLARHWDETTLEPTSVEEELDDKRYIATITGIIKALAERDNVVIIGRGSQVILRNRPDAIHVFITCPFEVQLRRTIEAERLTPDEAAKRVHDIDRGRAAYHKRFFKADWRDLSLYHLTLNSARLSDDAAAEIICAAVCTAAPLSG